MEIWGQREEATFINWLGTGRWVHDEIERRPTSEEIKARRCDYLRKYLDALQVRAHWDPNVDRDACRRVAENLLAHLLTAVA